MTRSRHDAAFGLATSQSPSRRPPSSPRWWTSGRLLWLGVVIGIAAGCAPVKAPQPSKPVADKLALKAVTPPQGVVLERACVPTGPELCFNALDDNCNGLLDEGCGLHTGLIQFSIAWSDADADLDLVVRDPKGEIVEVGKPSDSGLVKERDCPGARGECLGQNLENVFLEDGDPPRGKYRVVIRLEKLGRAEPPINVTFGARVGPKTYAARVELSDPEEEKVFEFEL